MAFCWRADDSPTLNFGLVAFLFFMRSGPVLLRNPIFCDFSGGGGPDPLLPLWIRACLSFCLLPYFVYPRSEHTDETGSLEIEDINHGHQSIKVIAENQKRDFLLI